MGIFYIGFKKFSDDNSDFFGIDVKFKDDGYASVVQVVIDVCIISPAFLITSLLTGENEARAIAIGIRRM